MPVNTICIIGAGTMGTGIALAAALSGYKVLVYDPVPEALDRSAAKADSDLKFLLDKNKINAEGAQSARSAISYVNSLEDCIGELIIEAIVEKLSVKQEVFSKLAMINSDETILASNTSSLSISAIQQGLPNAGRVAGMHFFNPANVMKLVELVKGKETAEETIAVLKDVCLRLNKTAVVCRDAPGFIVNRVARPYYLEAMKIAEEGIAAFEDIDKIMEASGFKMGPFRLMDLIGMDVNLAVSHSVYEAFEKEERFKPNRLQIDKVANGDLGKKTGKGFYDYDK